MTSGNLVAIADNALENAQGELTPVTQCYAYNGLNRLESAWTITGSGSGCASSSAGNSASLDTSATKYASAWEYSTAGRVTSVSDLLASTSRAYDPAGVDPANPAAVHTITNPDIPAIPAVPAVPPSEENPEGVAEIPAVPAVPVAADTFTYDALGRMTERVTHVADPVARTVTAHTLALTWDASSNLVKTIQDGHTVVYVYDSSGQRVAQIGVTAATATAYLGATELTDPNTGVNATVPADLVGASFITGTRYYTLGGATVAVRQAPTTASPTDKLSFLFGDVQGSAEVMVTHTIDANGALSAITADSVHRNAYTPYGATRGSGTIAENDNLTISKGWLNQVSDEASTGLVYLNARYYDPLVARFLSPDPQMNPSDPKTLDPYRYAEDNPITYTDATGFCSTTGHAAYVGGVLEQPCDASNGARYAAPKVHHKSWWQRQQDRARGAAHATWDAALNEFALVAPSNSLWVTERRISMYQGFMQGVKEYGWGTQIDRTINPVHQFLEAGDATVTSFKAGDDYGVGYNGFNAELAAGSTALVGYGGAKLVSAKLAVGSGTANSGAQALLDSIGQPGRTAGVLNIDGELTPLISGRSTLGNYAASGHVEGQAALIMRAQGASAGELLIDNPNGICGYCVSQVPTLLPEGAVLRVVTPQGTVPKAFWFNSRTILGNASDAKVS